MAQSGASLATVMFTDVQGSTELRTTSGDDEAQRVLRAAQETISQIVEDHEGVVVKALGDGIFASFASPRQAVYGAIAIQRAAPGIGPGTHPLAIRIGINTGEVIEERGDLFGEAVNAAARISALAEGGTILVSSIVKELVGTLSDVVLTDQGMHRLRGFPDEWRLFEARGENRVALSLDQTPFVGRQAEMTQLDRQLDRALKGHGTTVMIGGEPGVGKTRLANQLADEARRRGFVVFSGSSHELETAMPFAPFIEILEGTARTIPREVFQELVGDSGPELARLYPELRTMFPDMPPPAELPEDQARRFFFNSVSRYVARAAALSPVMLVLDDLHWADEATLQLLEHLAGTSRDLPLLIAGTYRDVELAVGRPLAHTLEQLIRAHKAHRVSLKRLSREDVSLMLQRLAGSPPPPPLVDAIYNETEGNAFFVEEVFRHLMEEGRLLDPSGIWKDDVDLEEADVPESIRLVIGRRVERLGEDTRMCLTAAAVMGRVFDFSLLDGVVGETDLMSSLEEAERARLIDVVPHSREARYQFVHELVRQTLLAEVSLPRRQMLHLKIAQAIESSSPEAARDRVSELAHHMYQAGAAADLSMTVRYLEAAADHAMSTGGSEEAARAFELALGLVEAKGRERGRLLFKLGRALRGMQRWEDAMRAWSQALEISEAESDSDMVARVSLAVTDRHTWNGRWDLALAALERGLRSSPEPTRSRGLLLSLQGVAFSWLGQYEDAVGALEAAEALAQDLSDQRVYWTARSSRAVHHWCFNEQKRCVEVGLEASEVLRSAGALWALATVLSFVQFSMVVSGSWEEAQAVHSELDSLANKVGHPGATLFSARWKGAFDLLREADFDHALVGAEDDLRFCQANEMPWVAESYTWIGLVFERMGEWEKAREYFVRGDEEAVPGAFFGPHRGSLALHRALIGDASDCLHIALEVEGNEDPKPSLGWVAQMFMAAEGLIISGEFEALAALRPHLVRHSREMRWRAFNLAPTDPLVAASEVASGNHEAADRLFASVMAEIGDKGANLSAAQAKWLYGRVVLDRGDPNRGALLLHEAADDLERLQMGRHAALVRRSISDGKQAGPLTSPTSPDARRTRWIFTKEGEVWTVGAEDHPVHLRDSVGLAYLAQLLKNPGVEIAAGDLAGGDPSQAPLPKDSGEEVLDERARMDYRRRVQELREEIDEARGWSDGERAAKLEIEMEALMAELTRATGLGGRARRTPSTTERARVNVTKALRAAIKRIEESDPTIGAHLSAAVKTGTLCVYSPPPGDNSTWLT